MLPAGKGAEKAFLSAVFTLYKRIGQNSFVKGYLRKSGVNKGILCRRSLLCKGDISIIDKSIKW
jgi:hypothetical protein